MKLYRNIRRDELEAGMVRPASFPGSVDSTCPQGAIVSFWLLEPISWGFGKLIGVEVPDEAIIGTGRMTVEVHSLSWYEAFSHPTPSWWDDENLETWVPEVYVDQDIHFDETHIVRKGDMSMDIALDIHMQSLRGDCEGLVAHLTKK